MSTATTLMTADEYARIEDRGVPGVPTELVRGEVVEMHQPTPEHGIVCGNIYYAQRSKSDRTSTTMSGGTFRYPFGNGAFGNFS